MHLLSTDKRLETSKMNNASAPTFATWGAMGGLVALFLLEPSTLVRSDILQHIPVAGGFWKAKLEAAERKD